MTETDNFPDNRSEAAIPKVEKVTMGQYQPLPPQEAIAVKDTSKTGECRLVVEPSPTCKQQIRCQPNTQQPPQSSISKRHHLAKTVVSPARQSAAARHSTGVNLHNRTSQAPSYPLDKQHMHFTQYQNRQPHQQPNQSSSHRPLSRKQQQRSTSQTILLCPTPPSQRRCSTQQPQRACIDWSSSRRQPASNKYGVSQTRNSPLKAASPKGIT
jgi:hypothetical protein